MPEGLDREIWQAAEAEGVSVSTWIAHAALEAAHRRRILAEGRAAIAEWQAENGAFTPQEQAAAHDELVALGVLPPTQRMAS